MSLYQRMFVVNHISTFLVMWLPVTSVLLDSIRLTYCLYHISFKFFSKKWRCPYIVSIIYSELYWCLLRTHEYTISSLTKCCHLNGYDFIKHCLFDIFLYVCKHHQISVYIVHICMLFILLPCIYSRTLAHVATVTCWLYPTLNKFHLILSYLIDPQHRSHGGHDIYPQNNSYARLYIYPQHRPHGGHIIDPQHRSHGGHDMYLEHKSHGGHDIYNATWVTRRTYPIPTA